MTVKQVIVGTLLGAAAVAATLHRLSSPSIILAMNSVKPTEKSARVIHRPAHRKHVTEERLSMNKVG